MRLVLTVLATCAALPAAAEEAPFCGGISLVGSWVGGASETSDLTGADQLVDLAARVPIAGHAVHLFSLSEPGTVRADIRAVPDGDPYAAIYDETGNEVASDDDSGGDLGARIVADLPAGTYCLASRSYETSILDVSVLLGPADLFEYGDLLPPTRVVAPETGGCGADDVALFSETPVDAATLETPIAMTAPAAAQPALQFALAQEDLAMTITAVSETGDPLIRLRGPSGEILEENDDFDGLNARIDLRDPPGLGVYCVEVEDLDDGGTPITVTLGAFDPVAERLRRLARMDFAPGPDDPVQPEHLGELQTELVATAPSSQDAIWFTMDLPQGGLMVLEAVATDADPELRIFDRAGREVAHGDDSFGSFDSFVAYRAAPGRYTIGVRARGDDPSGEIRLLAERFVPAQ
ncbi:hypothetical protein [Jannaschia aquimarina]|uniref:Peptidase C-terminal archaeal/bacterial domain-containing protein n=1 Tax=Jannaschia aquimarina TaxID=935700 RepID=A0A0D1EQW4_9RHOB|nr:hypothetical protein [Jannaschia aquimarina]KIT18035.1 hypothetical protein jaqu_01600 [Jannaschia aquimarina]SNS88975.1 hypothetical protein SAMN05421775_103185 [Jannaschia aquimarina]